MTREDDFQVMLDANPKDWHTMLVFADWLQDQDDPRAAGYRGLALLKKHPALCSGRRTWSPRASDSPWDTQPTWTWYNSNQDEYGHPEHTNHLPDEWMRDIMKGPNAYRTSRQVNGAAFGFAGWLEFLSRREATNAAALAFRGRS